MSRILITGASAGLGRATAIELAERGHSVIATARRPDTLVDLPVAGRLQLDVTDAGSARAAIAEAGPLDAIASNAGATIRGTVEAIPLDVFVSSVLGRVSVAGREPGPVATEGASKAARYDSPPGYSQVADAVSGIAATGIIDAAVVATAIADTLEDDDPPLHVPVGTTAQRLIAGHRP